MLPMDIYDSIYFRLNKKQMCVLGLWPYDSRRKIIALFWIILYCALNIPHLIGCFVNASDIDRFMENLVTFSILTATFLKHFTLVVAEKKMKMVYNDIASNWLRITDAEEKKILIEYSKKGRILTIAYSSIVTCASVFFMLVPLVSEILNAINPLPVAREHVYILKGEFLINKDDHFFKIYLWDSMTMLYIIVICVSIDSMYTVSIEQGTALYAIVTHRLSKLRHRLLNNVTDNSYEWIIEIVRLHQVVLSFISNVNDSYSLCFLCLTIINMIALPVTCIIVMISWQNPVNFLRYAFILASLIIHVFVLFWPGQKVIDHSTRLIHNAYCNDWYETPLETKKLLRIFMLRCSQPSLITAGGLVEMNFENFAKVIKTAVSYVTVVASFRNNNY